MKLTVDLSNPDDIKSALTLISMYKHSHDIAQTPSETRKFEVEDVAKIFDLPVTTLVPTVIAGDPASASSTIVDARTDKHGRMYDARIDSSNRELLKDGEWCKRRKPKDMTDSQWLQYRAKVMSEYEPASVEDVSCLFGVTQPVVVEEVKESTEASLRSLFGEPQAITYEAFSEKLVKAVMDPDQPYFTGATIASACASCKIPNLAAAKDDPEMLAKLNKILFPS